MEEATLTIRLPISLWEELEREASAANRSPESVVTDILRRWLQHKKSVAEIERVEPSMLVEWRKEDFFDTPLGKYVLNHTNPDLTLEEVRKATSRIKGSWAADIIASRENRI